MNISNLKPYPFGCKLDENEITIGVDKEYYPWAESVLVHFRVSCSCGAQGPHGWTHEEAVERWNKRRNE